MTENDIVEHEHRNCHKIVDLPYQRLMGIMSLESDIAAMTTIVEMKDEARRYYVNTVGADKYIARLSKKRQVPDAVEITEVNRLLLNGTMMGDEAGRYRRSGHASIVGSAYPIPPFEHLPRLMAEYIEIQKSLASKLVCAKPSDDIDELMTVVAFSHYGLSRIHPFIDGNGRSARLISEVYLRWCGMTLPWYDVSDREAYLNSLVETGEKKNMVPLEKFIALAIIKHCEKHRICNNGKDENANSIRFWLENRLPLKSMPKHSWNYLWPALDSNLFNHS